MMIHGSFGQTWLFDPDFWKKGSYACVFDTCICDMELKSYLGQDQLQKLLNWFETRKKDKYLQSCSVRNVPVVSNVQKPWKGQAMWHVWDGTYLDQVPLWDEYVLFSSFIDKWPYKLCLMLKHIVSLHSWWRHRPQRGLTRFLAGKLSTLVPSSKYWNIADHSARRVVKITHLITLPTRVV